MKINCIVIPGINDTHVEAVSKTMSELGADNQCLPLRPVEGVRLKINLSLIMTQCRKYAKASQNMKLVKHCAMCRADAARLMHRTVHLCMNPPVNIFNASKSLRLSTVCSCKVGRVCLSMSTLVSNAVLYL